VLLVRVPLAIVLAHSAVSLPWGGSIPGAGLGVVGAWYGAVIDIVVRCGLLIARFRHDAWQRIDV
jgi:Na+-driven multidrug efflux pump